MNEKEIQWVENEDWLYRTSFVLTEEQSAHEEIFWYLKDLILMRIYS